jgi:hypothetical protein
VEFDVTSLKQDIPMTDASRRGGRTYYRVALAIEMRIVARNLEFTARYNGALFPGSQKNLSVVSMFHPGTK